MAKTQTDGRPIPLLVLLLLGSFVLMILSGVFYGLGLPEDWARGLFVATVLLWIVLGVALIAQGMMETRAYTRAAAHPREREETEDGE